MALKTEVALVDDLDGVTTEGVESYIYCDASTGQFFEIDLSPTSYELVFGTLNRIAGHGRPIDTPNFKKAKRSGGWGRTKAELGEIRQWALDHGYNVSGRGRLAKNILDDYDASLLAAAPVADTVETKDSKRSRKVA